MARIPAEHAESYAKWAQEKQFSGMNSQPQSASNISQLRSQLQSLKPSDQQEFIHKFAEKAAKKMVSEAAATREAELNEEMARLDNLTDKDILALRRQRMVQMHERSEQREKWKRTGHGTFDEIVNERDFYTEAKRSVRVIVLFYVEGNPWCSVLSSILQKLAFKHYETRFLKMNAERAPIIVQQLNVIMMPTLICCKNSKIHCQIPGLDQFNPTGKLQLADVERTFYNMGFLEELHLDTAEGMDSIHDAFDSKAAEDDLSDDLLDL